MNIYRPTLAEIDEVALLHNFHAIKERAGSDAFLCPMVKANAYGHGMKRVSKILEKENVDALGVVLVEEGIALRLANVQSQVLVFGTFDALGARAILENDLTPVISRLDQISVLEKLARNLKTRPGRYKVHLKLNTGMNRLGFDAADWQQAFENLKASKNLELEALCTHFASSELAAEKDGEVAKQTELFMRGYELFENKFSFFTHALNTSAICHMHLENLSHIKTWREKNFGLRPGLGLYGGLTELDLQPVMILKSQIVKVLKLKKGDRVSYGGTWTATADAVIGVLPIGYGDGYLRSLSDRCEVMIRENRVRQIGRICMDHMMIDLTPLTHLNGHASDAGAGSGIDSAGDTESETIGDTDTNSGIDSAGDTNSEWLNENVILFGHPKLRVEEVAAWADTISYELLTRLGPRIPRVTRDSL